MTMNLTICAEDIMTPRRLLKLAFSDDEARAVADDLGFDAVPVLRPDGSVREFWSRADRARVRIIGSHKVPHDSAIERLLPALGEHVAQFVYYRCEMVGLIDASDLNKPIARMAWLHPMVELERAILDVVRHLKIDDQSQAEALRNQASATRKRQKTAGRHNLEMPLLEYAQFGALLNAAVHLQIVQLSEHEIAELNEFRKCAAHGAINAVIGERSDCSRLNRVLKTARSAARFAAGQTVRRRK